MSTLFSVLSMLFVFVIGGLIGYVIALMQELLEAEREINDINLRIIHLESEIEACEVKGNE